MEFNHRDNVFARLSHPFRASAKLVTDIRLTYNEDKPKLLESVKRISAATNTAHIYMHADQKFFRLNGNGKKIYNDPILVIGTDGVGTKLKIAQNIGKHDTVGIDLVAMCVNDILCNGAQPLTFLDYYACDRIEHNVAENVIKGIADGSTKGASTLIAGKCYELPHMYGKNEYDLAGFAMGVLENGALMPRIEEIEDGDKVIALPSSGVHSNGFSLVHKVMEAAEVRYADKASFSCTGKTFGTSIGYLYLKNGLRGVTPRERGGG